MGLWETAARGLRHHHRQRPLHQLFMAARVTMTHSRHDMQVSRWAVALATTVPTRTCRHPSGVPTMMWCNSNSTPLLLPRLSTRVRSMWAIRRAMPAASPPHHRTCPCNTQLVGLPALCRRPPSVSLRPALDSHRTCQPPLRSRRT